MPFLKALMPCATSPIRSEILPRPNSSRTTAITTIQCQMLSEPILQPSKHARPETPPQPDRKIGSGGVKNKDLSRVKSELGHERLMRLRSTPAGVAIKLGLASLAGFRLDRGGQGQ